jgi:hypothetical protein
MSSSALSSINTSAMINVSVNADALVNLHRLGISVGVAKATVFTPTPLDEARYTPEELTSVTADAEKLGHIIDAVFKGTLYGPDKEKQDEKEQKHFPFSSQLDIDSTRYDERGRLEIKYKDVTDPLYFLEHRVRNHVSYSLGLHTPEEVKNWIITSLAAQFKWSRYGCRNWTFADSIIEKTNNPRFKAYYIVNVFPLSVALVDTKRVTKIANCYCVAQNHRDNWHIWPVASSDWRYLSSHNDKHEIIKRFNNNNGLTVTKANLSTLYQRLKTFASSCAVFIESRQSVYLIRMNYDLSISMFRKSASTKEEAIRWEKYFSDLNNTDDECPDDERPSPPEDGHIDGYMLFPFSKFPPVRFNALPAGVIPFVCRDITCTTGAL